MKIALLASRAPGTGTFTTSTRLARHFQYAGHTLRALDTADDPGVISQALGESDFALGIHAYRSGIFLVTSRVRYALVFGGTDLNCDISIPEKRGIIDRAVAGAEYLVAFSTELAKHAEELWPIERHKIKVIQPAVEVFPSSFSLKGSLKLPSESRVILLPSGLRAVKDPLHLAYAVSRWHAADPRVCFVIAGSPLCEKTVAEVIQASRSLPGIIYVGELSQADTHSTIAKADLVANSSHSEGVSNTILEAMALGTPVIARRIPGNAVLIEHRRNGLLYDAPEEFVALAKEAIDNPALRHSLVHVAQTQVKLAHSPKQERESYLTLLTSGT